MRDRVECFCEIKENCTDSILVISEENQELIIDNIAVSVENPGQKLN